MSSSMELAMCEYTMSEGRERERGREREIDRETECDAEQNNRRRYNDEYFYFF
jgi:hypothetical protein